MPFPSLLKTRLRCHLLQKGFVPKLKFAHPPTVLAKVGLKNHECRKALLPDSPVSSVTEHRG